jgi:hypothetical protein
MTPATPLPELIGHPLPDLALPASDGGSFALRARVGVGPLALFLFIRNGTPG